MRVPKAPGTHYAFSGAIDPSHAGFRSGVALLDLAAAVNVSSIGDQRTVLDRLVVLLGDDANEVGVKRLLPGDVPLSRGQCLEIARQLERHAEVSGQLVSFRLGAWVEAARMASQHEVSTIVNDVVIEYFLADPGQGKLPAPVREALEKLSRYKEGQVLSDKDYRDIRRLLNEIADIH
ncbi:hypothetical protein [Geobacter hydrogenophilus]|nr:hypothetical protein [Geobacter hydrogenophilus]